jgi:aconitate hydratase
VGLNENAQPRQPVTLVVRRQNGAQHRITLTLRLDTPAELDYVRRGGILPYVLEGLMA